MSISPEAGRAEEHTSQTSRGICERAVGRIATASTQSTHGDLSSNGRKEYQSGSEPIEPGARSPELVPDAHMPTAQIASPESCSGRFEDMTNEQLAAIIAAGGQDVAQASEALLHKMLPMVRMLAGRTYRSTHLAEVDDLVQVGLMGVLEVAGRYDQRTGNRFITPAYPRVQGAIKEEIRHELRRRGVSQGVLSQVQRYTTCRQELTSTLAREPLLSEVAAEMGVEASALRTLLSKYRQSERRIEHVATNDDKEQGWTERLVAPDNVESEVVERLSGGERAHLAKALLRLTDRQRQAVEMYYGLNQKFPMTLSQMATVLGVSESSISQTLSRARSKMHQHILLLRKEEDAV